MATDVAGHTVPGGSDYAARKSLLDLSLTIPGTGIKTCASEAAANLYVTNLKAALSTAGLPAISADNPVYVRRSDRGLLMVSDGSSWRSLSDLEVSGDPLAGAASGHLTQQVTSITVKTSISGGVYVPVDGWAGIAGVQVTPRNTDGHVLACSVESVTATQLLLRFHDKDGAYYSSGGFPVTLTITGWR